jgi:transcriptional regulator with XRE-family HTH domain
MNHRQLTEADWPGQLREARQMAGLNRAELARRAMVSAVTIRNIEDGLTSPRALTWARISAVLPLSPDGRTTVADWTDDNDIIDRELSALNVIVGMVESLNAEQRQRVLTYISERYGSSENGSQPAMQEEIAP